MKSNPKHANDFYNTIYKDIRYAPGNKTDNLVSSAHWLIDQIKRIQIPHPICLEIGCGRGTFQDAVQNYFGIDLAFTVNHYFHKPFICTSATNMPFSDSSFDIIWSVNVLEHIPDPEQVLSETRRVLKNGGLLFLSPAWYCRPWAAQGYSVRSFSDLDIPGKIIKFSIPIRNSTLFRSLSIIPKRLFSLMSWMIYKSPSIFRYGKLQPNYSQFWISDGDATNSMDPFETVLWFQSRGDRCLNYPTLLKALFIRTGGLVLEIHK